MKLYLLLIKILTVNKNNLPLMIFINLRQCNKTAPGSDIRRSKTRKITGKLR